MLDNEPPGGVEIPINVVSPTDVDRVLEVGGTGNEDTEGKLVDRDEKEDKDRDEAEAMLDEVTDIPDEVGDFVVVTSAEEVEETKSDVEES